MFEVKENTSMFINDQSADGHAIESSVAHSTASLRAPSPLPTKTDYPEVPKNDSIDVVGQLRANIKKLEDLQGHLAFVTAEIRGIVPKR